MNKSVLVITTLGLLLALSACSPASNNSYSEEEEWNGGYCKYDDTKLEYISTGSREHFKCSACGREYSFSRIYPYKNRESE